METNRLNAQSWPEGGLEYLGCCPICSSKSREIQYSDLRDSLWGAPGIWTLFKCKSCNVRYLDPRPNKATIRVAYNGYYTHEDINHNSTGLLFRIKQSLKNGYLNNTRHTAFTPSFSLVAKCISIIYPGWATIFERLALRELPRISGGHLLDIGCGGGNFLVMAKRLGWSVCGIDFDQKAIEVAQKHNIDTRLGGVELFAGEQEIFDVITSNHVIEHVHEPKAMIDACWRLLKKGGTLRIESPNFDSVGRQLFESNWRGLEVPRHLVIFNTSNMKKLLIEAGFTNIRHAGWMPQFKPMYQVSKNLQNGDAPAAKNLSLSEKVKIWAIDRRLRKDESAREFFTFICIK